MSRDSPIRPRLRTELEIDDITGSDLLPDDLKVCAESWDNYSCLRIEWEVPGICYWLFWSHNNFPFFVQMEIEAILLDLEGQGDFLVQFWEAEFVKDGLGRSKRIVTGRHRPFGLNSNNIALYAYASMSRFHESDATSEQGHSALPNRVFQSRQAVFTTERRAYPIPPRAAAIDCNITASLAYPLFMNFLGNRGGVFEIVTNSGRPTNELSEIFRGIVSKYAKDDWKCCYHLYEHNDKQEKAREEINKSLEEVRTIYNITLSRTWIPCKSCDALFHIHEVIKPRDNSLPISFWDGDGYWNWDWDFDWEKGEEAARKAFLSNKLEFCESDSVFNIVAVPLRRSSSLNEEDDIYVVEFFLSPNHMKLGDWRTIASLVLSTMEKHLKSVSIASGDEIGKDLSVDDHIEENGGEAVGLNSSNQEKENLSIDENPKENGSGTLQIDSPNQKKEKNATTHAENNNESCTKETNTTIMSSQQKLQHRKAGIPISLELLQQHSGMKLDEAANSIGVSRSTVKRACREYGILWWQSRKRKNKDNHSIPKKTLQCAAVGKQIGETSEAPISNPSGKQHTETNIFTELQEQDISSVTIKAKFGAEEFIRFKLPVTSGMREFQHQVEKRLHWKDGTYSVLYRDDDNDPILVKIDEDLQEYICSSREMGRSTITVSLQPITNFPN